MNWKNGMFLAITGIILMACTVTPPVDNKMKDIKSPGSIATRSVVDPTMAMYLGDGYDLLTGTLKNICVDINEARRTEGERYYNSSYTYVEDSYDLENQLNNSINMGMGLNLFDTLTVNANFTANLKANLTFSSKKITVIGTVKYVDGTAFISIASMKPEALTIYSQSLDNFRNQYGDGYVNQALMGEMLYLVFQCDYTSVSTKTSTEINAAVEVKFQSIFNGNVSASNLNIANKTLSNTSIYGSCYATGGFTPGPPIASNFMKRMNFAFFQSILDKREM